MTAPSRAQMEAAAEFTPAELGHFAAGYLEGWSAGWAAHEDHWQLRFGLAVLDEPTAAALADRRAFSDDPCKRRCRNCSRCIRYAAAWRNQRDYGSPDFPGGAVPSW